MEPATTRHLLEPGDTLAAWLADRLGWHLLNTDWVAADGPGQGIAAEFQRTDGISVRFRLMPVPPTLARLSCSQ